MLEPAVQSTISLLTKRMQQKAKLLLEHAKESGLDVYVFESLRSQERHRRLFGKGRDEKDLKEYWVPTNYAQPDEKIVTRTLQSMHLAGEAVDIVFDTDPDPKKRKPSRSGNYKRLIELSSYYGLTNLAPLDTCHFQDNGKTLNQVMKLNSERRHATKDSRVKDLAHSANERIRLAIGIV